MDAKWCQKGGKREAQTLPKATFYEKVLKVIRTYYLLYIINIYRPENPHFSTPRATKNACGARAATFSLHGRHFGPHCAPKMARVGSTGCPNAPEGLQNTSKNPPKNDTWQAGPRQGAPGGAEGTHPTPKVPQNTQNYAKTRENTVNESVHFCGGSSKKAAAKQWQTHRVWHWKALQGHK